MSTAPEVLAAISYLESQDQADPERASRARIALEIIHEHWDKPGRRQGSPFPSLDHTPNILNHYVWESGKRGEKIVFKGRATYTVDDISSLKHIDLIQPIIDDTTTIESFLKKMATWSCSATSVLVSSILWNLPKSKGI